MTPVTSPRTRSQDPDASPEDLDDPSLGVPESQRRLSPSSPGARPDAPGAMPDAFGAQTLGEADAPDAMPLFPMLRSPMVDARSLMFTKTRYLVLVQDHGVELVKFPSLLHDHGPRAFLGRWSTFFHSGLI